MEITNERLGFILNTLKHNKEVIEEMSTIIQGFIMDEHEPVDLDYDDVAVSLAYITSGMEIVEKMRFNSER